MKFVAEESYSKNGYVRAAAAGALFFSVFFLDWKISCVIAFAGLLYFDAFVEAFAAGLFMDAIFGTSFAIEGFRPVFSFAAAVVFAVAPIFKAKMRFWNN